ncbi:gamma-glutamyltransferase family protein [Vibrio scophthalmi]|uniref:gamma-glutamyltransferase family protein n=1 Tax=Vibrio scophthalmi TaxID=45658 RepID=UPI002FF3757C
MKHQTAFTAPHHKAAEVGQAILDAGGTASEAMVAAAAMISVQYPHMNSIGGDGFWLIAKQGQPPVAIDGSGDAAAQVDVNAYRALGDELPDHGALSAITMAGTVAGWQAALEYDHGNMTLDRLLTPAIDAAREGITATQSLVNASEKTYQRLASLDGFADIYLNQGETLKVGDRICNPALADTLSMLAEKGLEDFYRGDLAQSMADDLAAMGSPIRLEDFHQFRAKVMQPLHVTTSKGTLYNFGAPTQGVASLLILAIYDRLAVNAQTEVEHMHCLVEATKQAFLIRDREVCDEASLREPLQHWLSDDEVTKCTAAVNPNRALAWPHQAKPGDTIWMGASDQYGTMVSFIQSIYWEFGSGVVLPKTGVLWNIRSKSFSLDAQHHNVLAPNKKPFHTLNPAYAELSDGRRMSYGTMGGEGQPQTQACLFSRYHYQSYPLDKAISEPRWLLGRTWGDATHNLRLERSLDQRCGAELVALGHDVTTVDDNNELMGHAGAIVLDEQGRAIASSDPRSDGRSFVGEQ